MINKNILNGLKGYVSSDENLYHVADMFPRLLGNLLRIMSVYQPPIYTINLMYDQKDFYKFQINMSHAIANNSFDTLDDIVLGFIETYYYGLEPNKFYLQFGEGIRKNFIEICNSFKGKHWNDILNPFIDSLNDLLSSGIVNGMHVTLG